MRLGFVHEKNQRLTGIHVAARCTSHATGPCDAGLWGSRPSESHWHCWSVNNKKKTFLDRLDIAPFHPALAPRCLRWQKITSSICNPFPRGGRPSLRLLVTVHDRLDHTTVALLGRDRMVNADRRTRTQAQRYGGTHSPD